MKITKEKIKKIVDRHRMMADIGEIFLQEMEDADLEYIEHEDFMLEKRRAEGE